MDKRFYGILLIVATLFITQSFISEAQIVRDGIKIRLFSWIPSIGKNKARNYEFKDINYIIKEGMLCCHPEIFDRIEFNGEGELSVTVQDLDYANESSYEIKTSDGDTLFYKKFYLKEKMAIKPFDGYQEPGDYLITIRKENKVILQFKHEYTGCM